MLNGANLSEASLEEADLSGANLSGAKLKGVTLKGAKYISMVDQFGESEIKPTIFPSFFDPKAHRMFDMSKVEK